MNRSPGRAAPSSVKPNKSNPNAVIQTQLQMLRAEQEKNISDIVALEQEKQSLLQILPKVYYELDQLRERIENNTKELLTYENAIEEIERNYGNFLFSPEFFSQEE